MAMKYEGQPVENIQWNGINILSGAALAKITISTTRADYRNNVLTMKFEAVQGDVGDITISATRVWGEIGVSENREEKTYVLSSSNPTVTYDQTFGDTKYSPFDYLLVKTASNKGSVKWEIKKGQEKYATSSFAIIPANK